ncbi:MAG: hypothetical protein EP343_21225 [Deltaproteobacteria bacterium]|nr:MAG: hypothetical protein EP343_21225 [Deltaproteobacteria bacterium]
MKVQGSQPGLVQNQANNVEGQAEIVCPVIRGMVSDGHLNVDAEGNAQISELKDIFEDLGFNRHLANVAVVGNKPSAILGNLFGGTFNVNDLRGGLLDHSGDSMILRNGKFDPERFDVLVSHSSDGQRMTTEDFQKAIQTNKTDDDASWIGSQISKVEFRILLDAFGTEGPDGVKGISIDDLRNLYENKQIPSSFRPVETATPSNDIASLAGHARNLATGSQVGAAKAGLSSALQGSDLLSSGDVAVQGMGKGACPYMGQDQSTAASSPEVVQLHNEMAPTTPTELAQVAE